VLVPTAGASGLPLSPDVELPSDSVGWPTGALGDSAAVVAGVVDVDASAVLEAGAARWPSGSTLGNSQPHSKSASKAAQVA
jgi:hypothetical protein